MRKRCFLLALLLMAALLTGCMRADGGASGDAQGEKPQLPEDLPPAFLYSCCPLSFLQLFVSAEPTLLHFHSIL